MVLGWFSGGSGEEESIHPRVYSTPAQIVASSDGGMGQAPETELTHSACGLASAVFVAPGLGEATRTNRHSSETGNEIWGRTGHESWRKSREDQPQRWSDHSQPRWSGVASGRNGSFDEVISAWLRR